MRSAIFILLFVLATPDFGQSDVVFKTDSDDKIMKVLVVFYSRTGNTRKAAEVIAKRLNADIERIIEKGVDRKGFLGYMGAAKDAMLGNQVETEPFKRNPEVYDLVVIGTPVWMWDMTPAIRTYLLKMKGKLQKTKVAFFITSSETGPEKIVQKMEKVAGVKAVNWTGLTDNDVKDEKTATEKLDVFVKELESF